MIPYEDLGRSNAPFVQAYERAFRTVLDSGWFVLGMQVSAFEREFASFVGVGHCVGVGNCLDGLTLALRAFAFEPGAEVIVPSNTYIATILAVVHAGLSPVLVEPDPRTYNIDPARIARHVTPRTRAVLVVHLHGKPCEMHPIVEICRTRGLRLVEDCAQSHDARYRGTMTGAFGDFGCFSFYPTKNLGSLGDAGAVVTSDEALADKVRALRNYGSRVKYYNEVVGFNSRLDELQAAFLRVKLPHLAEITAHKRHLAGIYHEGLAERFTRPVVHDDCFDVYHIYSIRHPDRDRLRAHLRDRGVATEIHYPVSPNRQVAMKGLLDHVSCPISEEIHATTLSLPIAFCHTEDDVREVIRAVNAF